jgi:uncharacterized Ntn-hydrolase superfamily protein
VSALGLQWAARPLAGGDIRGRQSAALLVVSAEGEDWETNVSLRVEDHPERLAEIRRLVTLKQAYDLATQADALVNEERHEVVTGAHGCVASVSRRVRSEDADPAVPEGSRRQG